MVLTSSFFRSSFHALYNMNKRRCGYLPVSLNFSLLKVLKDFDETCVCDFHEVHKIKHSKEFESEESSLLAYDVVSIGKQFLTFRRILMPLT